MPTGQLQAVGAGGVVAIVLMGLITQIFPDSIDWTAETSGVPLGAAITFLGSLVGGWLKGAGK